ncbi:UDP-N-acetylglucosamine 1-carboxyvinyltransferase [Caldicellulosiruptoraceae bacterium PP1]
MPKYLIEGGRKLSGSIRLHGAKNAILPIMAAAILSDKPILIEDVLPLEDIKVLNNIMEIIGVNTKLDETSSTIQIQNLGIKNTNVSTQLVNKLRASILLLGSILAREKKVSIVLPGGCNIGARPIDLHIKGLSLLGAEIKINQGIIEAKAKKLRGNKIYLDFPSVGATENIMIAATYAEGETIIENAATEPEIVCLANFLNTLGAKIWGAGTDTIRIIGVDSLNGGTFAPIPDRIEAGTYMALVSATGGNIRIENVIIDHIRSIIAKLSECGVKVTEGENYVVVNAQEKLKATDIKTLPYPGFPTDMQAQIMAMLTCAKGTSMIIETIFENRYQHACELVKMGANIKIDGRVAIVEGVKKLSGTNVKAQDLRGGAALVIAGLIADGITEVDEINHIDRGYYNMDKIINSIGGKIERID